MFIRRVKKGQFFKYVPQVAEGFESVGLGGFDQAKNVAQALAPLGLPENKKFFLPSTKAIAFRRIVVGFQPTVFDINNQAVQKRKRITDGLAEQPLGRRKGLFFIKPVFKGIQHGLGLLLAGLVDLSGLN